MRFDPGENYPKSTDYRESRPISPYSGAAEGNWAAWGEAFKAAGDVYKSAITGYDAYQEELVKQGVRQIADRNRDSYTDRLEESYDTVAGKSRGMYSEAPPVFSEGGVEVSGQSRLPPVPPGQRNLFADKEETPPAVENRLNRLKTIEGARAKGSISNTQYWGMVDSELKELRDRFPNYADTIDRQASAILGTNPANAYVSGLVSDINSFIKQGASQTDKIRNEIIRGAREGFSGMKETLQDFDAGKIDQYEALNRINKQASIDRQAKLLRYERERVESVEAIVAAPARREANFIVTSQANTALDTISWGPGFAGREGFPGFLEGIRTGKIPAPNSTQSVMFSQRIDEAEAQFVSKARQMFLEQGRSGRTTVSDLPGKDEEMNKYIEQGRAMFKFYREHFTKDKIHLAEAGEIYRNARTKDVIGGVLANDSVRVLHELSELGKMMPGAAQDFVTSYIQNRGKVKGGAFEQLPELVFSNGLKISNPNDPYTPLKSIEDIKRAEDAARGTPTPGSTSVPGTSTAKPPPRNVDAYDGVIKQIEMIGNPKVEDAYKVNVFNKTFSPEGQALISKFASEGQITKYGVWNRLASPDMANEIKRLSGLPGNAGIWEKYNEWMKTTFANEIFKKDILDLDALSQGQGVTIGWNDKTYQFTPAKVRRDSHPSSLTNPVPMAASEGERLTERRLNAIVSRLNEGLSRLANIAKASGDNPNDYLVELLAGMGYSPMRRDVPASSSKVNVTPGLPEAMFRAVLAEQMKYLREEQEAKAEKEKKKKDYNK